MTHASFESFTVRFAAALCLLVASASECAQAQAPAQAPAPAPAEDATRAASARALFEEGVALADQGHWQEAADRFRRALALHDSAVIAYNLASALQETGQLVEASELLRRVSNDASADAELHTSASNALADVERRIGKLTLHVQGQQAGDQIRLDEREVVAAELDVALPIDPGAHVVRVRRGEQVVAEQALTVADGQAQDVSVQVAAPVATPREVAVTVAPKPEEHARSAPDRATPLTGRWWFWAGLGTAAVGIGVAVALVASGGGSDNPKATAGDFEPGVVGVEVGR
jgi:tetratricopeptide (TPR) repeat protein